jgi:hypothetical protein
MDNKKLFTILILSLIFGYIFYDLFNITHPLYLSTIIMLTFVGTLLLYNEINKKREQYKSQLNFKEIEWNGTKRDKNFNEKGKVPLFRKKNKLPFDGLGKEEIKKRFDYLYYATSHPFEPKSYHNWKLGETNEELNSVKHLKLLEKTYPEMSSDMLNAKDCLNHPIGSELSCNQSNSILVQGINSENKDLVITEDFKRPDNIKLDHKLIKTFLRN